MLSHLEEDTKTTFIFLIQLYFHNIVVTLSHCMTQHLPRPNKTFLIFCFDPLTHLPSYRVSHKTVPTSISSYLLASTHPNCPSFSKFPGIFKTFQTFVIWMSRSCQNSKKQSGHSFVGHPVFTRIKI